MPRLDQASSWWGNRLPDWPALCAPGNASVSGLISILSGLDADYYHLHGHPGGLWEAARAQPPSHGSPK